MSDDDVMIGRKWFHSIQLPDGRCTRGRFGPHVPPNYTLFGAFDLLPHVELEGARCVDLGAMDGLGSFVLASLGAGEVIAGDLRRRSTFTWAAEQLGLAERVDYRVPLTAQSLPETLGADKADLVLMAGVLYHVYDPIGVLMAVRESLRPDGLLVLETLCLHDDGRPVMSFNLADHSRRRVERAYTYWRPTKAAVHGMLRLASFDVLATRMVNARLTVLAQAKPPHEIAADDALLAAAQSQRDRHYREEVDFAALDDDARPARVRYRGPRDDRFLYRARFAPSVPHQPRWAPSPEVRARDLARSAAMHAAMRLGEARARLRARGRAPSASVSTPP